MKKDYLKDGFEKFLQTKERSCILEFVKGKME